METQSRLRPPSLKTQWSEHEKLSHLPRSHTHSARFSPYTLSPRSPSLRSPSVPRPMYPRSPGYDHSMRRHERAMVDSLDQRGRRGSDVHSYRSLSPIAEANWEQRRNSYAVSPASPRAPAPTPITHPISHGLLSPYRSRDQTLAAESRSILLAGAHPAARASVPSPVSDRRHSLPPSLSPAGRRDSAKDLAELQAWGLIFLRDVTDAVFVSAVSLQYLDRFQGASGDKSPAPADQGSNPTGEMIVRALLRPHDAPTKPRLIRTKVNMDGLRATVPRLPSSPSVGSPRRGSSSFRLESPAQERRYSTGSDVSAPSVKNTAHIHSHYAAFHLPVIALLIFSGHVKTHDILEVPMPHPTVWKRTVEYLYTGRGELTDAMKQNILYLGGKV
ncbi:hypothetical protein QBC34DRAFT_25084 [Podospora aff. communis PSN243]|uniref:BTB domain-containing protein n=1 Tax=Podospora aff. communis PSN243 TaxID=3040156 RepID=A0AAV9G394_9PEZI|nr:hypothetical protein QBC34DRAFT_25084 [Podospora aff. communis PSN243]